MKRPLLILSACVCAALSLLMASISASAQVSLPNPIVFVARPRHPSDFGTINAVLSNHLSSPQSAGRGGDLYIRYTDGTLKNLTLAAGYGGAGLLGANGIQVRDPAVSWDANKVIFSMIVGAPARQYDYAYQTTQRWQLYEITGLGPSDSPTITKVPNQPTQYNNIMPSYGSDDHILFISDRPRDGLPHTYPQRDEYESAPTNTGVWSLDPTNGALKLLDHSPSGDYKPRLDSFGRVIFTRWDHLQRDQQRDAGTYGTFDFSSEAVGSRPTASNQDIYPEPRDVDDPHYSARLMLHTVNHFFPWQCNEDGTELELLNHAGRHELSGYKTKSFTDDPNLRELTSVDHLRNANWITNFLHIREDPLHHGTFIGVDAQEFGTHAAGQLVSLNGAPSVNPDDMVVTYLTHPDTKGESNSPSANHSGLYRDPLILSDGSLLAVHTAETRSDVNVGSTATPNSRYDFRIKKLKKVGNYWVPDQPITSGISKTVSYWDPDTLNSYNNLPMWEMEPVELVARSRPARRTPTLPATESNIIQDFTSLPALRAYLEDHNLALVISRNVTTRDHNDILQPFNLKIAKSSTQTIGASGKIYPIQFFQIFQGDLLRGMYGSGRTSGTPVDGRRVLARPLHDSAAAPFLSPDGPTSSVELGADGSMAAFVPARRALSYQLTDTHGAPVVRERFWLTFQPGEIRVCASCHGVNTVDQAGNPPPTNAPQALRSLLSAWKSGSPTALAPKWALAIRGGVNSAKAGKRVQIQIQGKNARSGLRDLTLRLLVNGYSCPNPISTFTTNGAGNAKVSGTIPKIHATLTWALNYKGSTVARLQTKIGRGVSNPGSRRGICATIARALE